MKLACVFPFLATFTSTVVLGANIPRSPAAAQKNPKRGLCFAESDNRDIAQANTTSSVLSWQYNLGTSPPDYLKSDNIEYIPMQWGASDFASQSNIDPTTAANLWKQYIEPLAASGVKLGAPTVTNAPSGRPWLSSFLQACTGCTIDFIPLHWCGQGVGKFYDYLWQVHGQFPNHPLWVTEFATTSSNDTEVLNFLIGSIKYLDSLAWIQGYSWFAPSRQQSTSHHSESPNLSHVTGQLLSDLLDANGNLNAFGTAYVTQ